VADEQSVPRSDPIAPLLELIRVTATRESAARQLLSEVHRAVYPLCLEMLGNPDDAYEAEAETVSRLLAHVGRDDYATAPIDNGTAYVRQIARNVCHDMRRRTTLHHHRSIDDLHDGDMPAVADHATTMYSPVTTPLLTDRDLASTFGYTSSRALADLAGLSEQERPVVILRQEGYSYIQIAALIGAGLSPQTAQKHGERGLQKLRGLAHVGVWRQQSPARWTNPPCPDLARLKTQVQQRLIAGTAITAMLYLEIGRHLNPDPNRRPGEARAPRCELCEPERERSRREYWWLLILLLPFPAVATRPTLRLTASLAGAVPAAVLQPAPPANAALVAPGGHRNRTRWATAAAALLLLLIAFGGAAVLTFRPSQRPTVSAADMPSSSSRRPTGTTPGSQTNPDTPTTGQSPQQPAPPPPGQTSSPPTGAQPGPGAPGSPAASPPPQGSGDSGQPPAPPPPPPPPPPVMYHLVVETDSYSGDYPAGVDIWVNGAAVDRCTASQGTVFCDDDEFPAGTVVTFTLYKDPRSLYGLEWYFIDDCSGQMTTCRLTMDHDRTAGVHIRPNVR
jgi:DNA-directed RNA polymerase specialized sigma24 family protein